MAKELTNDDMFQVMQYKDQIQQIAKKVHTHLLDKDVVIIAGRHKGRLAKIEAVYLLGDGVFKVVAKPYNLKDKEFRTTLNDSEARRLRPLNEICPV